MDPLALIGFTPNGDDKTVACDGCKACCRGEMVLLTEGDDLANYPEAISLDVEDPFTGKKPTILIPHKKDSADCIYLGESGCTIYDKRPKMCRVFSCIGFVRGVIKNTTRKDRRRDLANGKLDREIWEAGSKRLKEEK